MPAVARAQLKQPLLVGRQSEARLRSRLLSSKAFPTSRSSSGAARRWWSTRDWASATAPPSCAPSKSSPRARFFTSRPRTTIPNTPRANRRSRRARSSSETPRSRKKWIKSVGAHMEVFRKMSAQNLDLLQNVKFRPPDVLFDREAKIDLGGVTARLFWLGPAHTKGDELIFVEEDSVLIPGDIVQKDIFPIMPNADASVKGWLSILDNCRGPAPEVHRPRSRRGRSWTPLRSERSAPTFWRCRRARWS